MQKSFFPMRRSRNCKATFKGTIVTFPLILSASLSPPAAILPLVNKKAQLRGGGIGNHRPEWGIFGQLHCHRREEYHSGYASLLFRASAANLPPSGAQRPFQSHLFWRKAGGRRQGGPPSKAGQRSAGANGAERDRCFPMSPPLYAGLFRQTETPDSKQSGVCHLWNKGLLFY